MRPEDAQELIGQRRVWVMELKASDPRPTVVTCTHALGSIRIDRRDTRIDIDQIWCEYRLSNGNLDRVWFTPSLFKSFSVSES
jgi:hypothetical protein